MNFNIILKHITSTSKISLSQYQHSIHTTTNNFARTVSKTKLTFKEAAHPSLIAKQTLVKNKKVKKELPKTFTELNLRSEIVDALTNIDIVQPSQIQALAIPKIVFGDNVCLAAETGSGKTLTYLAPIFHLLKQEETILKIFSKKTSPRAIILVPTAELCVQVLSVAKSLTHIAKLRAIAIYKGMPGVKLKAALRTPFDILISTPMTLFLHKKYNTVSLKDVSYVVFDELDTLFDRSFRGINYFLLKSLNIRSSADSEEGVQAIVAGASLASDVKKEILAQIPDIEFIRSDGLHKVLPHVEQRFYRCLPGEKESTILNLLKNNTRLKTIIFCNTVSSVEWLFHHLTTNNYNVTKLHGGLPDNERHSIIDKFQSDQDNILISTDIASRGIDTIYVKHVVMFDFPSRPLDYLHRVGRTGRLNPLHVEGKRLYYKVSVLVVKHRDIRLAEQLKAASRRKQALDIYSSGWK